MKSDRETLDDLIVSVLEDKKGKRKREEMIPIDDIKRNRVERNYQDESNKIPMKSPKEFIIDRRASKGRRLKFVPIEKLQGFMAPQFVKSFDDIFIDQLVLSLFQ